jgi:hypothetical protein
MIGDTTGAIGDPLLFDLIRLAEKCPNNCETCVKYRRCQSWLNRYIEISIIRNLTPHEQNSAMAEWNNLQLQISYKVPIMRKR